MIWRSRRKCLPTRANINSRSVECSIVCPLCQSDVETSFHMFFTCQINVDCWENIQIRRIVDYLSPSAKSCSQLIFNLYISLSIQQQQRVVMLLWSLWRRCNDKLWENKEFPDNFVVQCGDDFFTRLGVSLVGVRSCTSKITQQSY